MSLRNTIIVYFIVLYLRLFSNMADKTHTLKV